MTIEITTQYRQHELLSILRESDAFIAIIKPVNDTDESILLKRILASEETAGVHRLYDDTNPAMIENAILEADRTARLNYWQSNNYSMNNYPGTVICVHAQNLTNPVVYEQYWKRIWEIHTGIKDHMDLVGQVFFAICIDEKFVPEWIHSSCIKLDGFKNAKR